MKKIILILIFSGACTVPESKLVQDKNYPLACRHQLALLFQTQKSPEAQAAAVGQAGAACKAVLIDRWCASKNENPTQFANCRAFHAK